MVTPKNIGFYTWDEIVNPKNKKGKEAADKRTELYGKFLSLIEPVGQAMLSRGGWKNAYSGGINAQDPSWYYAFMNGDFDSTGEKGAIQAWINRTLQSTEFAARGNRNWEQALNPNIVVAPSQPTTPTPPEEEEPKKNNIIIYGAIAAAVLVVYLIVKKKK